MSSIHITGINVHNLKNISVEIPHGKITVVTGVSGSGKSSLALDTIYAEGYRRFTESLSAYVRQFLVRMERPALDSISGILPAIAIESRNTITNARSTVGTQTEINDYLRVLFARIGKTYCAGCGGIVTKETPELIADNLIKRNKEQTLLVTFLVRFGSSSKKHIQQYISYLLKQGFIRVLQSGTVMRIDECTKDILAKNNMLEIVVDRILLSRVSKTRLIDTLETAYRYGKGKLNIIECSDKEVLNVQTFSETFHCSRCDRRYQEPVANLFSFNNPLGACPSCQGFGRIITIDEKLIVPDESKSIKEGAINPWALPSREWEYAQLREFCLRRKIPLTVPFKKLKNKDKKLIFEGKQDDEYYSVNRFFKDLERKVYKIHVRVFLSKYRNYVLCNECSGKRLKPEVLQVKIAEKHIVDVMSMTIAHAYDFFNELILSSHEQDIAATVLQEIKRRLLFLKEVGLGYITLDRLSRTLSGGESQRINLASALGTSLVDTLYILDEPSIGLHARDNKLLIGILRKLKKLGNTVVIIEHDSDMMLHADNIIDLGPAAGERGGEVIYAGTVSGLKKCSHSITGNYLRGKEQITLDKQYLQLPVNKKRARRTIRIVGAREHNLKNIMVEIPLGCLVAVTGVSGSGKSTLVYDVLYNNFLRARGRAIADVGAVDRIFGFEHIADMVLVDQTPIGRTPRSNPATFLNIFSDIRKIFSQTKAAKAKRMQPGYFSFNVEGGRCEQCHGDGKIKVEMHFLANVYIPCEACGGTRFKQNTLDVRFKDKNIHDVLQLTVDEALRFFTEYQPIVRKLSILHEVGLGYLKIGQPATTISAGEAQRLKLAAELSEVTKSNMLFLFDEPTVGLHYHDMQYLMNALGKLLERGNSILIVEHNLEVIKCADYIIDLGPEGGEAGGRVLHAGTPKQLVRTKNSITGTYLESYLT